MFLCSISMLSPSYLQWQLSNMWFFYLTIAGVLGVCIAMCCNPQLLRVRAIWPCWQELHSIANYPHNFTSPAS